MNSKASSSTDKSRLVVVAGFLGAGKTTAIVQLAHSLRGRNLTCAVITNDHGSELVDNSLYRAEGISSEAIEGGDFCTQAEETIRAAARMRADHRAQVIIAEPAGTCADLNEMLLAPAKSELGAAFAIAPLTVIIDPVRAERVLDLEPGAKLTTGIASLYRKQLSEAEIILINKSEGTSPDALRALRETLSELSPRTTVFIASAQSGTGLDEWFECVMTKESSGPPQRTAAPATPSEALLAWLNCTVAVSSVRYFEAGKLLLDLAASLQSLLQQEGGEIAHLKIALRPDFDGCGIAAVSLARFDASPQLSRDVSEPIQRGELILNARAQTDPEILHSVVNRALLALMERSPELFARMHHCEHFKAGLSCRQPSLAAS